MPPKAVVGGRKANGEPLFVASLWVITSDMTSKYLYGYYDPETKLGSAAAGSEAKSNSTVDIMVEIWDKTSYHKLWLNENIVSHGGMLFHTLASDNYVDTSQSALWVTDMVGQKNNPNETSKKHFAQAISTEVTYCL